MLLALLASIALAADKPVASTGEAAIIAEAVQAMGSGRAPEALTMIEPVLAGFDRRHAGDTRQPLCGTGAREVAAAVAVAGRRATVTVDEAWCNALFVKGYSLADLRRFEEAAPVLERLVAMAPFHAHYLNELGYVYQQQRDFQRSYDIYVRGRDAAAFDDSDRGPTERTRGVHGVGYAMIELGRWDEAEALFNACLRADPNDTYARNELTYIEGLRRRPRT